MTKSNKICWEDIIFKHRNRGYGAYVLRYCYPFYLTLSALTVIILFLAAMIGMQVSKGKEEQVQEIKRVRVISYNELSAPPPIEKIYVPPPEEKIIVVERVKVEKYVAPIVVEEEVEEQEEMMTIEEVKENPASTDNTIEASDGVEADLVVLPAFTVEEEIVVVDDEDEPVFTGKPPEFPGGEKALTKWMKKNLKYPAVAKRMGVEGNVIVEFIIGEDGMTSDARVIESLHRLCDKEAVRLVKTMPAWSPAEENGVKISIKYTLTVPFILSKSK